MPRVRFLNENVSVDVDNSSTVRDAAAKLGINLMRGFWRSYAGWCGGRGLCGSCKVWLIPDSNGAVGDPTWLERLRCLRGNQRLACQARISGTSDVSVRTRPGGPGPTQNLDVQLAGPPKQEKPNGETRNRE